jgi:chromosome segregation ATPase
LQAEATSNLEEQLASQELARKEAEAHKDEGLKLRGQLHAATQEVRQVQIKVSAVVRKLVTAQQGVTSMRASMGRKRMEILKLEAEGTRKKEELRTLELDELKWMGVQDSTTLELIVLEEARAEK